jgi:quercetin dioxygenase-like cupin family protein
MQIIKTQFNGPDFSLDYLLKLPLRDPATLEFGTVVMPRGYRQPREGFSKHAGEEISLILKGRSLIEHPGGRTEVGPGDLVHIPAGEAHATVVLEECHVLFALAG